ncbi:MAG: 50S ribosomal protein L25 [Clostridia bacterium]
MSKTVLNANLRETVGTNKAKKLRQKKLVPGILYGSQLDNTNIVFDQIELAKFLQTNAKGSTATVKLDGEEIFAIVREVQKDPLRRTPLHIDFQALRSDEKIRITVPFVFSGRENLAETLILQEFVSGVEIQVLPKDLIDRVEIDISFKEYGDTMTIGELEIAQNEDIEILSDYSAQIYSIIEADVFEEPEIEEEALEEEETPEVVGEGEEEEESEEQPEEQPE